MAKLPVGTLIPIGAVGTAKNDEVLQGKTYSSDEGVDLKGTMPNNGTLTKTLTNQGDIATVAKGYYTGGTIKANITNLIGSNVKKGIKVGGVLGTYEGGNANIKEYKNITIESPSHGENIIEIGTNEPKFISIFYEQWSQYYILSLNKYGSPQFVYIDGREKTCLPLTSFSIKNNKLQWTMGMHGTNSVVHYTVVY